MKILHVMKAGFVLIIFVIFPSIVSAQSYQNLPGSTEILKWLNGKKSAISITYDGGTINQYNVALPIMNELEFKATFFVVTGDIKGSTYSPKFIGRPIDSIIHESAIVPIKENSFFERATAVRFLGYKGAIDHHTKAGDYFELGKFGEAFAEIDMAYTKVRRNDYDTLDKPFLNETVDVSWDRIEEIASQGHEFASHSISHPQMAICDDQNIIYELAKSQQELLDHLGFKHTFSHECPYGTENERVINLASSVYPALRNRMPEDYLEEINRWSKNSPTSSKKEYVQWQRGPKSNTSYFQMKSWVDTCMKVENVWLVLVFHGIEGIGWEPITGNKIEEYFNYIKLKDNEIWVATFQDVTKYIRERMSTEIISSVSENKIEVELINDLDQKLYNLPLTVKTYIPNNWQTVNLKKKQQSQEVEIKSDQNGSFVIYSAIPNEGKIIIGKGPS